MNGLFSPEGVVVLEQLLDSWTATGHVQDSWTVTGDDIFPDWDLFVKFGTFWVRAAPFLQNYN